MIAMLSPSNKAKYALMDKTFGSNTFSTRELSTLLKIKKSTAYWVICDLKKENLIVKPGMGLFKISSSKEIGLVKEIDLIRKHLLKKITRKFSFTGLSVLAPLVHHIPYAIIYNLFVEPGSAEDFKEEISKFSKITTLVSPTKSEISALLDNTNINRLIVIRENRYFYSSKDGLSSNEAAFIDLYFEVTREKLPFIRSDLEEIFRSLALNNLINYSTLLRYANERGIKEEIKKFLSDKSG